MKKKIFLVTIILLLGSFLRLYKIEKGSPLGDEADYGYRSYGLLDFEATPNHTTPLEWYDPNPLPVWLQFSFHDAPPLFFIVQHYSFRVFGENTFALRFPSAVFGIGTVILTMLLGKLLYDDLVGIVAGAFLSISTNAIYISRVGMLDSMVIFFIILTVIFYLLGRQRRIYFLAMGLSLGLGMMTKYTAIIAGAIITTDILIFNRKLIWNKFLWTGVLLSLIIFSPVLIYNAYLLKNFGHFDYALMNILGPIPDIWQENFGRDVGSIYQRMIYFIPSMFTYGFWGIVTLSHKPCKKIT
jgi:4-amino-4-deoxy-L-arabinose transferase-like glycosyltransferase